jgi:hypothetical protein
MIATDVAVCAVPFAETQAAASSCGGCESPAGNPGGGSYCTPGNYAPLPTPGMPYPTPAPGSPSVSDTEPGEPEEPEEPEESDEPGVLLPPVYPCPSPVFPVLDQ